MRSAFATSLRLTALRAVRVPAPRFVSGKAPIDSPPTAPEAPPSGDGPKSGAAHKVYEKLVTTAATLTHSGKSAAGTVYNILTGDETDIGFVGKPSREPAQVAEFGHPAHSVKGAGSAEAHDAARPGGRRPTDGVVEPIVDRPKEACDIADKPVGAAPGVLAGVSDRVQGLGHAGREAVVGAYESAKDSAGSAAEGMGDTADAATLTASLAGHAAWQRAEGLATAAKKSVGETTDRAAEAAAHAGKRVADLGHAGNAKTAAEVERDAAESAAEGVGDAETFGAFGTSPPLSHPPSGSAAADLGRAGLEAVASAPSALWESARLAAGHMEAAAGAAGREIKDLGHAGVGHAEEAWGGVKAKARNVGETVRAETGLPPAQGVGEGRADSPNPEDTSGSPPTGPVAQRVYEKVTEFAWGPVASAEDAAEAPKGPGNAASGAPKFPGGSCSVSPGSAV